MQMPSDNQPQSQELPAHIQELLEQQKALSLRAASLAQTIEGLRNELRVANNLVAQAKAELAKAQEAPTSTEITNTTLAALQKRVQELLDENHKLKMKAEPKV